MQRKSLTFEAGCATLKTMKGGAMFAAWVSLTGKKKACHSCKEKVNQGWYDLETDDFVCSMCGWEKDIPGIVERRNDGKANSEATA